MDLIRTCYSTEAIVFRDNLGPSVTLQWYRAPEGAKCFPTRHKWGSLKWYRDPWLATGVGEVYGATTPYANGFTPPTAFGQRFFGPRSGFALGARYHPSTDVQRDPWGIALDCGGLPDTFVLLEEPYNPVMLTESGGYVLTES